MNSGAPDSAVPARGTPSRAPGTPENRPSRDRLVLPLILLLALLVRIPGLGESVWYDEVVYTSATLSGESRADVLFHDIHPPLYAWLMQGWIILFGEHEVVLRLPSLIFGLASIAVTFLLARRWLGPRAAILCGVLLALSPAHIWYSQENKNTMLPVLMTSGLMFCADQAFRSGRPRDWACLVLLCLLTPWSHVHATWFVGAVGLWMWIQVVKPSGRAMWPRALAATVAAAIALGPMVIMMLRNVGVLQYDYLKPFTPTEIYRLLLIYLAHGNTIRTASFRAPLQALLEQHRGLLLVDAFYALALLAGITVAVRGVVMRRSDRAAIDPGGAEMLLLCLAAPLAGLLIGSRFEEHAYIERSLLSLLPAYALLLTAGATRVRPPILRIPLASVLVAFGIVGVWNLHVAKADVRTVYKRNPDWRSATRYLVEELEQGEKGFPVFGCTASRALLFYHPDATEYPRLPPPPPDPDGMTIYYCTAMVHAWVLPQVLEGGGFDRFYIVHNHVWGRRFPVLMEAAEAVPGAVLVDTRQFKHLTVYRFDVDPASHPEP